MTEPLVPIEGLSPLLAGAWSIGALFALGAASLAFGRSRSAGVFVYAICFALAAAMFVAGGAHLVWRGAAETMTLPLGLPWIGVHFRLDALSAAFLCIVNVSAAFVSLFAIGYGAHENSPGRVVPYVPFFLGGMNLVLLADDAFSFLLAWEFMSLSSWALMIAHHREPGNARAGFIYLLMASVGIMALLLCFGMLAGPAGAYDFASMRAVAQPPLLAALAFLLALVGAGSKAGLAPLHVWLPIAHPAAPSHVSALMSGAMTKVAVYGFIRIVFDLVGAASWWWAAVVLIVGALTAVLGVLFAGIQTDIKRTLAYSTIENIGFIFVGLGLALAFQTSGMQAAAALAFTAALFHAFNHALFKSLLFSGAGAVMASTGARDMEKMGGLIHRMPQTSVAFLAGCVAISALPPLNGFASEWLTLQAILLSPDLPQWPLKVLVPGVGGMLALSAALAAASFVRVYGVAFLGRPRSAEAAAAKETDWLSLLAMGALAGLCLFAGVLPGFFIDALSGASELAIGARMPAQVQNAWLSLVPIAESRSSYNATLVLGFMLASMGFAAVAIHWFASRAIRRTPAWDCGYPDPNPATQYSAGSMAQPIRRVFNAFVFRARENVTMPPPGSIAPARFELAVVDRVWAAIYAPISGLVAYAADKLNYLQFLTIRRYLMFVFGSLVLLLTVLALWT